jgi:hypothetical protein
LNTVVASKREAEQSPPHNRGRAAGKPGAMSLDILIAGAVV